MQNVPIASAVSVLTPQWKAVRLFSLLSLLLLFTFTLRAQITYPTFTTGAQTVNTVAERYGPTLTTFNGVLYEAYVNSASGHLDVATSTNGTTFSQPIFTGISLGNGAPSITTFNSKLYIAYYNAGTDYVITSSDGTTWSSPTALSLLYPPYFSETSTVSILGKPTIYAYGDYVYLAYVTNTTYGPLTVVGWSSDGISYGGTLVYAGDGSTAVSDPTITSLNGDIAFVFLTGANGNPVVSRYATADNGFANLSNAVSTGIELFDAPGAVQFSGYLFIFGQSIYQSEDNLWAIATPDGSNFETQHEYGQVVSGGVGICLYNGNLIEVARSKYDSNMWAYLAP